MHMKKHLYRFLSCMLLIVAAVSTGQAAISYSTPVVHNLCPGDTVILDTKQTIVYSDTTLYDTALVASPTPPILDTVITTHRVNIYPTFIRTEQERTIERGGEAIEWHGLSITKAGNYERVFKTVAGCDSIFRVHVRERVESQVVDTLCLGSSISFGGKTLTTGGIYRDTMHFNDYDSIIILSLHAIKPDTTITLRRIPEGASTSFDGNTYSEAGVYDTNYTNRFGCDSLSRLIVTTYHVDTIDTVAILCPMATITWHGMTYGQTGTYGFPGTRDNGDRVYYRINLTVKEIAQIDTTFHICDNEYLTFNGKTYANAGEYYDYYTCDTLYKITVVKNPSHEYVQYGTMDQTNPYYWQYTLDGELKTDTLLEPGRYVHTSQNPETGCNDHWILYLTRDESTYHFIETVTICENEPFSWRGRNNLNHSGIGQTTHYYDRYRTISDMDSIYELILTVRPVLRSVRTIHFCGSIEWEGKTYTETTTIVDSTTSVQYNCDSIATTILEKGTAVTYKDTIVIVSGETLHWHGLTIDTEGDYLDIRHSDYACDSTYMLHVELKEQAHTLKTHSDWLTICKGDDQEWRGKTYYNNGVYYDTIRTGSDEIDSLYILYLTVHESYALTERVSFISFPQTYRGQIIDAPGAYEFRYQSTYGCDSIITAYIDQDVYTDEQTVTICPGETYIWNYDGETYTVGGKYTKTETNRQGQDSVLHILNLKVNYIPETSVEHTMCKGEQYTFGGETLTQSGVYRHTFHKEGGCDSVVVLSLNVLNPDTTYLAIQRNEGDSYVWEGEIIREPGMYFHYGTNRFGCDSVSVLNFTYNQVDTVYGSFTVCPNELPFEWHGISGNQTKRYTTVQAEDGKYIYYVLDLTVREVVQRDTTFTICAGSNVSFNGVTYDEAGHYRSYLSCDTLMNVHIVVNQPVVYVTYGTMTDDHGFTWQYIDHGTAGEQTYTTPGTYEYENPNPETGCNDIYRLILTKDETSYLFEESLTICEGDDFEWHGLTNLSRVTGTNTYTDAYQTRAGKDSVYTLTLTVIPVERTVRTIVFCGETTWNGKVYTHSAVVYDTISLPTGCYRIERINLDKESSYHYTESKALPQGTVLHWHGQNITTDGTYYDYGTTVNGCDSTYEITVTIIPATPQTNQYAEELSACEGDTILWRGKDIWRSGVYVDTVYAAGTNQIDSIFSLTFTAWPAPKDTIYQHLYTCSGDAAIRYNGQDYYTDQTIVTKFQTIHGCDSIVKVYLHFNTALSLNRTDTIVDTQLPYTWTYQIYDEKRDTVLNTSGTYTHTVASEGGCTNKEELVLVVLKTYLFELDTTICESDLPLLWRGQYLQHTIGQTKQYEDVLKTVNNTDSIYRINLTIDPAPKRVERISICENKDTLINGKSYFDPSLYPVGVVFRDTAYKHNGDNVCDSIIYYEITKIPQRHLIETRIMHMGDTVVWQGDTITEHVSRTYTHETEIDPATGCEIIYQLRVIAEHRTIDTICVLDTPYVWTWNDERYFISGLFTDTVFDSDGKIAEYHTLQLTVAEVPHTTIQLYLCEGDKETLPNGKTYHNLVPDSVYRDTVVIISPTAGCDSTIYYEIMQHPIRSTVKNEILHLGDTIFWMGDTITQPITKTYSKDSIDDVTGCKVVNQLRVVAEHRDKATLCVMDTPFVWSYNNQNYYTTGLFTDTVRDDENFITEYHSLDLTVKIPVDTFRVLRGCKPNGVTWNGVTYLNDTVFRDTLLTCDTLYTIKIQLDTTYDIIRFDTICEHNLPYVVGQGTQLDSVYSEGWLPPFRYKTACGCDSTVQVHLTIIPDFDIDHSDSIFVCEESMPMYIGDTVNPAFDPYRQKVEEWKGKWIGVKISNDTIIYNCNKVDSLHIIMRPHQSHIPEYEYSLCKGDSVQLFWPHKDTWFKEPGDYMDTIPTISSWEDLTHHTLIHNDRAFACDSIVRWKVRYTDTLHVHLYEHIRQGDIYRFNDSILTTTGVYDSIGYYQDIIDPLDPTGQGVSSMDSAHNYCKAVYTLHLTVDPVYRYGDTIEICHPANREYTYTFEDELEEHFAFKFQTPEKDTAIIHLIDSTKHLSYEFYDHFYDLVVYYKQLYHTQIVDTLCYGDSIQFDQHFYEGENNRTVERYLHDAGIYYDTLRALNGCDSIIELRLFVRDRIIIEPQSKIVTDRELPYEWINTWREPGASEDTTHIDSLFVSGEYTYTMPNKFGCDSTVVLNFTVHQTHVFYDTLDICAPINTTFTHEWATGYKQQYTTPLADDTIHYYDTLVTFYPLDSIYDLYVNFHRTYETHVYDTICAGDSAQIDTYNKYTLPKRFYTETGIYRDTIQTIHGCDSVVVLHLQVWPGFPTTHRRVDIADVDTPYLWTHTWMANGQMQSLTDSIYIAGEYSRTLPNIHGCDSIDSLSLIIHQTYNIMLDTLTICHDQIPYTWEDKDEIRTSGFYTYKTQTYDGYDSIRTIYIDILPIMHTTLNASICEGDSMRFGLKKDGTPLFLFQDGVYFDTLTSVLHGCDSIIEMRLNVFPREWNTYEQHIADVDTPFVWEHKQAGVLIGTDSLYIAGKYEYIFQSRLGCDSIDSLTLYIHQTYRIPDDTINICEHDVPYTWRGLNNITATGDYQYGEQTVDGYDSVHYVHINVWKQTYDTIYATICEGDSMRWGMIKSTLQPRFVHTAGLYNDTTINSHGCDHVNVLNLTVHPRYYNEKTIHIADVDTPYVWKHYNAAGDSIDVDYLYATDKYGFRFETTFGCDSIDSLNLFVHNTYLFTEEFTICERQTPYTWQNRNDITESGTYIYNPRTLDGYDSIYIATITVMPTVREIITEKICKNNLPFDFHGTDLWQGGIYIDTLASEHSGCDSIVELHLTVNDPYYHFERHDIYEGETFDFFGEACTTGGTYTHNAQTHAGCDSITEVLLVVHPLIDTVAYVCAYDLPFVWVNHWTGDTTLLQAAGLYHNKTLVNDEPLFWSIQLHVIEPIHDTIRAAICDGSSYPFMGMDLKEAGIYRDTTQGSNGCDSITTLILTVNQPYYSIIRENILEGNSVEFYGETYTTSGTYTHYARTPEGCDSTTVLQLTVHPLVDTVINVCDIDLPVIWHNRWNGQQELFYSAGLYRNDTTINSEKRFYGIQVNVSNQVFDTIRHAMCEGASYDFNGNTYYEAGIYRDTLQAANGCDSIVTLILTVNQPYYNIIRENILEGQYYVFYGDTIHQTMTITHSSRTPEGCDSTTVLALTVHQMVDTVITVCSSELPYIWHNRWSGLEEKFYEAGLYRNDTTINKEHMFYGIRLLVTEPTSTTIYREICEGSTYNFNNRFLTSAGEYRDTLKNTNGCDSIIVLHLNVLRRYYNTVEHIVYEGDSVLFQGQYFKEAGTYPFYFTSSFGCDSIIELRLVTSRLFDDSVIVCTNDLPYRWTLPSDPTKQMTIYETGIYRDTLINSEGLQTVIGLKVNVLPIAHAPEPIIRTICEGDYYKFGNAMLTEQGTYYDTLTAVNGCDSVVMLALQVLPRQYQSEVRRIYEGDSVFFNDTWYKESGVYERRELNENGCTDTYQLILTVLKEFHIDTTAYVCANELPYTWYGIEYSEAGDYAMPIAWTDSSRVVKTLHLFVRDAFYAERSISLCEGNVFIFRRDTFRTSTYFYDTIPSRHGCDSIIKYTLQVHPKYERWDTAHISDKDYYDFNGRQLTIPGDYEYVGKTSNDCDSSIYLHLEVHPSYLFTEYRNICAPDTIHWHGQIIQMDTTYQLSKTTTRYGKDTTYTYRDPYLTRYGFDSIYELKLVVHPSYYIYEQHLINDGETTTIHGIKITKTDSIYGDTLKTIYGCDSIYQIAVNTKRMIEVERDIAICDGNYYDLYGQKLTKAGKYTKMSPNGDTIAHINLTVNPVSVIKQRIVITDEEVPYIYGGHLYTPEIPEWDSETQSWDKDVKTTIENSYFLNQYGCDSTVYLEFVVTTHYSDWTQIPLCSNETLIIDNDTITHAGYYTFVRRSNVTKRMDSLYRVEVYEAPRYEMPAIKRTICEHDTVHFFDRILSTEGEYTEKLKSIDGCDSIITLKLTVTPTIQKETSVRIYEQYLPYIWAEDNRECYKSGDYLRTWQTGECINSSILHLTVVQPVVEERIICGDDSIKWRNDQWYNKEGYYYDTIYKSHTDTITDVFVLHLVKGLPTQITGLRVGEIQEDANDFQISFTTDNGLYYTTKVNVLFNNGPSSAFTNIYDAQATKNGDNYIVSIPVPHYTDTCYENHRKYIKPGYYSVQVQLDNGACARSESETVEFLVKYPSWIIEQNWQDIVAPLNANCNCGYEFSKVEWKDEKDYPYVSKASDYLHNPYLKVGDQVVMWATRKGEKVAIPTHPLTIVPYTWQRYDDPILVYPTQAPRRMPIISIKAPQGGQYAIYSSTGSLITQGQMGEGVTSVTLPNASGMYFIRTTHDEQVQTHKVLIY